MATAVIGGLIISTLLSLLVVPAFYVAADGVRAWLARWVPRRKAEKVEGVPLHRRSQRAPSD
jgi:predicted PurR-regulated permease PerM